MTDTEKRNGAWYCRNCGYLPAERVTFHETCDACREPVAWQSLMTRHERDEAYDTFAGLPHQTLACRKHLSRTYEDDRCPWCRIAELERTFDLRRKADMRAIERWRAEKPGERELRSPDHADLCVWLLARIAELETVIQSAREDAQREAIERRIGYDKTPCSECSGLGTKMYGSTATWRGGIGGQMITGDVCDRCWGSGDADMPWPSWRKSDAELGDVLKAAREDKLFQELEHRYMTVCADLDRLRSENEALRERIATVFGWPDTIPVVSGEKADRHTQEDNNNE